MTVEELIEQLNKFPKNMEVVIRYDDPGSDEPLILPIVSSNIDVDTFWDYDKMDESEQSIIIKM